MYDFNVGEAILSLVSGLSAERRKEFVGESQEAVTWVCNRCGPIRPIRLGSYWMRRLCSCDVARLEQEQRMQLRQEQQTIVNQLQRQRAFTWLAPWQHSYSEDKYSFASYSTVALPSEPPEAASRRARIVAAARQWAASPTGNFFLWGQFGVGKTHLLIAICYELIRQGKACLFGSVPIFFEALQDMLQREGEYRRLLFKAIETPILLLDDLDKVKPSEFREQVLYTLLNERMQRGVPTAISANHDPQSLTEWIGAACASRLMDGLTLVKMDGLSDYRVIKVHQVIE